MDGVKKTGDRKYTIRVQPLDPATGKRVSRIKTVEADSERDAFKMRMAWEAEVKEELEKNLRGSATNKQETVKDYCEFWLDHPSNTNRKPVQKINRNVLEHMIWPLIGSVRMVELSREHVLYWQREVQKLSTVKGETYSRQSYMKSWRLLRSILNQATRDGRLKENLAGGHRFSPEGKPVKSRESISQDELSRLILELEHEPLDIRAMFWVQLTTGCRFSELTALEWTDLDMDGEKVVFQKSQYLGVVGRPKTGRNRMAALLPVVISLLESHKSKQVQDGYDGTIVFPSKTGTYRAPAMMYKVLKRICKNAGVQKQYGSHSLRRTFNDLAREQATALQVRSIVGHATQAMHEHYSTVRLEEKRTVQENALAGLLGDEVPDLLN